MDKSAGDKSAIVIGGGPSGASAALGLLRSGYRVTLLEQRARWTGRVCGAFLSPEAVARLEWLGVLEDAKSAGAVAVKAARLTAFPGTQTETPISRRGRHGLGLSRETLEKILWEAVRRAGAQVLAGTRARAVRWEADRWQVEAANAPQTLSSALLVLADGRFSLGNKAVSASSGWFGWNASFEGANQKPGDLSLHFYPGGYVGVLTFANGESNVCGLAYRPDAGPVSWARVFEEALDRQPALRRLLSGARLNSEWRGVGPLPFFHPAQRSHPFSAHGPFLRVGDAAAVGDPFLGEGIARALGAGPRIHDHFRKSSTLNPHRLTARHSLRLGLALCLRQTLRSPVFLRAASSLVLRHPKILRAMTPLFH
jgi:flavin-dependent dehydrogenase